MVKLHVPVWGNFCREVRFKCKKMGWPLHWKKNFVIIPRVFPWVTVQQKLLNTFGWIFHVCLIGFCHKTAEMYFICIQQKLKPLFCPTNCLHPMPTRLLTRENNMKIQVWLWFCIVWTVFNTRTTWHFHYYMYCLGKITRSMPLIFPHFIMAAIPHVRCDVGSGRENEQGPTLNT